MIRFLQKGGMTQKVIFGVIIFLSSIAMVWYLIPGGTFDTLGGNLSNPNLVASVDGNDITVNEVEQQAQNMGRQEPQFQHGIPEQLMPFLRQRAAQSLIAREALVVEAKRMGMKATDQEMAEYLHDGPLGQALFPGGQFIGRDNYESWVDQNFRMSVPQFEQMIKNQLLIEKLQAAITGPITVTPEEVKQEFEKENVRVKLQYAVLSADQIAKSINPTDSELKAFYEQNKARYANSIPETRKVQYVVVDMSKLHDQVKVTPEDLQAYYQAHQDEFRVPERVNVRHILIKTPPPGPEGKVDPTALAATKAKAEDILKQLKAGADFAVLAKKYSQDEGSAANGGSLGWITRGRTVPEFENAAFSLPPGQISGIVQSPFGFHIIKVDEHQQAHLQTLDEVKSQIEPQVAQEKAGKLADQLVNQLQGQAHSLGLAAAAAKHGLDVVTSGYFSRTDSLPGLGTAPEFMQAVFSAPKTQPAQVVRIPQGYAIFEVLDVKPPATPTFEQIKDKVANDFRQQRVGQLLEQKTQELSDRARAQHDLAKAAKELGATVKTSDLVGPNGQVPDIGSMSGQASVAFSMKPGDISGPIDSGANGIVLTVTERHEPSTEDLAAKQDTIREQILQKKRGDMMELFADDLIARMEKAGKIKKNKEQWDRLTSMKPFEGS